MRLMLKTLILLSLIFFSSRAGLIAVGLSGFVVARNSVVQNRRVLMETRARIVEQARREGEEEFRRREEEKKAKSMM